MDTETAPLYRFGPFEVDPGSRRLTREGEPLSIQDKPLTLLIALLEQPGELISREQLAAAVWGAGTYLDVDSGLNTAIRKLRKALEDSAANPRFIETVPGHGYRILGQVEVVHQQLEFPSPRKHPTLGASLLLAAAMLVAITTAGLLGFGRELPPSAQAMEIQCANEQTVRIAVLPFEGNSPASPTPAHLAALSEEITAALWRVDSMRLAAKPIAGPDQVIATDTDLVLAARVGLDTDQLKITIELREPEAMTLLWQRSFQAPTDQSFNLRNRVAATVASFVHEATT